MLNTLINNSFVSYQQNINSAGINCSVGTDITSKDKQKIFLKANTPITDKISERIQQLRADSIIDDEYDPDDNIQLVNPTTIEELIASMSETVKNNPLLSQYQLTETLQTISLYIRTEQIPIKLIEHLTVFSKFNPTEFEHTLCNLIFGTHIGKANNYSLSELHDLMCVLFYEDVGFARLDLTMKNAYKVHPLLSKEIVEYAGISNPIVLESILQHEEKLDGTGYPNKLTKINEYAQISQIANQYSLLFNAGVAAGDNSMTLLGKIILLGQQFDFRTSGIKSSVYEARLQKPLIKISLEKLQSAQQLNQYAKHLHQELSHIVKWSNSQISQDQEIITIQQKIRNALWVSKESSDPFQISTNELSDTQLCREFINDAMRFIYSLVESANYLNCNLHKPIEKNGYPISGDTFLQTLTP